MVCFLETINATMRFNSKLIQCISEFIEINLSQTFGHGKVYFSFVKVWRSENQGLCIHVIITFDCALRENDWLRSNFSLAV